MIAPYISIIIPTYNSVRSLTGALRSILNQYFRSFEIVIIDNCSTDDTITIANGFHDERVKVTVASDSGVYDAMNKGISLSAGKWLYFMGSDDELFDETVLARVAAHLESGARLYYGDVLVVGDTGWAKDGDIYDGLFTRDKLVSKNICHQAIFYDRSLFSEYGGFSLEYPVCADFDFNLRVAANVPLAYMPLCIARFRGGGVSAKADRAFFQDHPYLVVTYFRNAIFAPDFRGTINFLFRSRGKLWAERDFGNLLRLLAAVAYQNAIKIVRRIFS